MIREVHLGWAKWNDVPYKFEGGTPNIAGAIGLGVAVDYLTAIGMDAVRGHEMEMTEYALEKLARLKGVQTYGPRDVTKRAGVVSFTIDGAHPHDIASILDVEGICVRSGHHCAQPLMERFNLPATARASYYVYNDLDDIDALVAGINKAEEVFACCRFRTTCIRSRSWIITSTRGTRARPSAPRRTRGTRTRCAGTRSAST